jgi:thiol-disulfide isomerase/thioredoxin
VPSLRRWAARALDVIAVLVVLVAVARFFVLPRLHRDIVQAPPVSLATLDGGRFDLERLRGRLVFLDFWASWCDPCRASIPLIQHFKRTHPQVDVISIDVGEPAAIVRPFAVRYKMKDVALDPDETVRHAFGVTGYPTVYAIDGTGRIRGYWPGLNLDIEREMSETVAKYGARKATAMENSGPSAR